MHPASAGDTVHSIISGGYTEGAMHRVTPDPLDVQAVARLVAQDNCGAVTTFVGLVRDHNLGRRVLWLEYEAYGPLAIRTFERIGMECAARWPSVRIAVHHRVGRVDIGEASVVIAAASAHRAETFAACRYAIERVKQIAPVWKHEHFEGGDVWIEGATADPEDDAAREAALARAWS